MRPVLSSSESLSMSRIAKLSIWMPVRKPPLTGPRYTFPLIALVSCHRGLTSRPGAQGVGRAATEAFVASFIAILVLDFFLAMFLNRLYLVLWPSGGAGLL